MNNKINKWYDGLPGPKRLLILLLFIVITMGTPGILLLCSPIAGSVGMLFGVIFSSILTISRITYLLSDHE